MQFDSSVSNEIMELVNTRREYTQLFSQFQETNRLHAEQEELYRTQIDLVKKENKVLLIQNNKLSNEVLLLKSKKKTYYQDVKLLEQAAEQLEIREQDLMEKYSNIVAINEQLNNEILQLNADNDHYKDVMSKEMISLAEYQILYVKYNGLIDTHTGIQSKIENEYVSINEYNKILASHEGLKYKLEHEYQPLDDYNRSAKEHHKLELKIESLEEQIRDEMVDKELHIKLQEKCNLSQRKIENEMISIEEYKNMVARCEKMKLSSELEMIGIEEYNKLRGALQGVIEDKLKYESLYKQSEESKGTVEAIVIGLKGRIEKQEMELVNCRRSEHSYSELQELNNTNNIKIDELKQDLRVEREQNENSKAALLLQIGNLQSTLQNEVTMNGENSTRIKKLNAALSSIRDSQERLLLESNNKLANCNGKIQDLMNINSENNLALDKKVNQQRLQAQKVTHELIKLKQENTRITDELRDMKESQVKKVKELKSKLKIKSDAYHQLQLDVAAMKTQLQGFHSMQIKLTDYETQMKSINDLVFSEYGEYCDSSKLEAYGRSPHK